MNAITIKIIEDEYLVPYVPADASTDDGIYYTDDRDDAIGTAVMLHGDNVKINFRRTH